MNIFESFKGLPHRRGRLELERISEREAILWLSNPAARNAMSIGMMHQLKSIVEDLENSPPNILIIRGKNRHFCAGGDLDDVKGYLIEDGMGSAMCEWMTEWTHRLQQLPTFIIVALEGAAVGGGAELLTLGDWIVAEKNSKIGFVQARLGVTTGWGGGARLIQRIGKVRATQLLAMSPILSAIEAHEVGLIDHVADSVDSILEEQRARLMKQPPKTFTRLMTWLHQDHEEQAEQKTFSETWGADEHRFALGVPFKSSGMSETNT